MDQSYDHARDAADKQIAKEQVVHDELDALECDLTELWDDYYEIPYGSKYRIRIKTELPVSIENKLYALLDGDISEDKDHELTKVLSVMTAGIYVGENLIKESDVAFWENSANWNMRKVESILMSYLGRLKEEREAIYSFPGAKAGEGPDNSRSDEEIE